MDAGPDVPCHESEEVIPIATSPSTEDWKSMSFAGGQIVRHLAIDNLIDTLTEDSSELNCAEQNHSDVVPGVYEGGAKVWECTQDLGDFLTRCSEGEKNIVGGLKGKSVLDLGCGAGILGILALKAGALVHFQDYVSSYALQFRSARLNNPLSVPE